MWELLVTLTAVLLSVYESATAPVVLALESVTRFADAHWLMILGLSFVVLYGLSLYVAILAEVRT